MPKNIRIFPSSFFSCFIASILFFSACKSVEKAPIGEKEMKDIMLDIHFAEAYSSIIVADSNEKKTLNKNSDSLAVFYKQIFKKHNVTAEQYELATKWYNMHPKELDSIYAKILPVLDSIKSIPVKNADTSTVK